MWYLRVLQASAYRRMREANAKRLEVTIEMLQAIKLIKLADYTSAFRLQISQARDVELAALRVVRIYRSIAEILLLSWPVILAVVTFTAHIIVFKHRLTPTAAFSTLAVLRMLDAPLETASV